MDQFQVLGALREFDIGYLDFDNAGTHIRQPGNRSFGKKPGDEGEVHVLFDGLIITNTAAEKAQDMAEVGVTMHAWEYRMKWYCEDEKTAKTRARRLKVAGGERVR